jgi:hypothetical protein
MGEMKRSLAPQPQGQEIQFITSPHMHSPDEEKLDFFSTLHYSTITICLVGHLHTGRSTLSQSNEMD